MDIKFLILIPAYNASKTISAVIDKTDSIIRSLSQTYQILIVNDGSSDETIKTIENKNAIVITHDRNTGKGSALKTGFAFAAENNYTAVITLDADNQHDPTEITKFIREFFENDFDIIIGSRKRSVKSMSPARIFSNWCTSWLLSLRTGCRIPDSQSGYRLIKTDLLRKVNLITNRYETESELIIEAGRHTARFGFIPIQTIYAGETSHIRHLRDTWLFIKMYFNTIFR
jgi:glycosyltransferase involved in cell wall biosynthesis